MPTYTGYDDPTGTVPGSGLAEAKAAYAEVDEGGGGGDGGGGGLWSHIETIELESDGVIDFQEIGDHTLFRLTLAIMVDTDNANPFLRLNDDSGNNYDIYRPSTPDTFTDIKYFNLTPSITSNEPVSGLIVIQKPLSSQPAMMNSNVFTPDTGLHHHSVWNNTSDLVDRITLDCDGGNLLTGSLAILEGLTP